MNLLHPLMSRVGTVAATYLVAYGATEAQINEIVAGLTALILLGVDLVLARVYRDAALGDRQ
ncbi:hypothetical protein N1F91_25790 [Aquibium sp. ELW1220]|nr:hypothetical protein [Aquibium sp. ELW1220]